MSSTFTYTLKHPFEFAKEMVTEMTFSRPKAKHLKGIKDINSSDGQMLLLSNISGEPLAKIEELDLADLEALNEEMQDFLQGSQKTGAKS